MAAKRTLLIFSFGCTFIFPMNSELGIANTVQERKYGKYVHVGSYHQENQDGTLALTVELTAGDFFSDLKRVQLDKERVEFWKGKQRCYNWPNELTIELQGWMRKNAQDRSLSTALPFPMGRKDFFKSIRFETQWKRGEDSRKTNQSQVEISEPQIPDWEASWRYSIQIHEKDVPLTDHLILSLFASDGKLVTRFSIQL